MFVSSCWVWLEQACTWYTYAHCYSLGCKLRWSPLQPSHFGSGILASVARLWAFQSLSRPSCSRGGCSTKNESSQMYQRQRLQSVFLLLIQTETVCAVPARISLVNPRMIAVCVCMCVCVCGRWTEHQRDRICTPYTPNVQHTPRSRSMHNAYSSVCNSHQTFTV